MNRPKPPRLPDYLQHIALAIERIQRYVADLSASGLAADDKTQDAVLRNIEVIGEAARNVQRHHADFAAAQSQVPWAVMIGMRNRVSHGYFSVDWDLIWATVHQDLPTLSAQINALLIEQGAAGA
jgi:uncharacterized protein with HEPN domain